MTMFDNVPLYSCPAAESGSDAAPAVHHALSASQAESIAAGRNALITAASLPRDEVLARQRLLHLCAAPDFAAAALNNNAPALPLAATVARLHGNLTFGLREGSEEWEAFAWDMETNVRAVRLFRPRPQQESRRAEEEKQLTAALLDVLPAPLLNEAIKRCRITLSAAAGEPKTSLPKPPALLPGNAPGNTPLPASPHESLDDTTPAPVTHPAEFSGESDHEEAPQAACTGPVPCPSGTPKRPGRKRRSAPRDGESSPSIRAADAVPADEAHRSNCGSNAPASADENARPETEPRRKKNAGAAHGTALRKSSENTEDSEAPNCRPCGHDDPTKGNATAEVTTAEHEKSIPDTTSGGTPCSQLPAGEKTALPETPENACTGTSVTLAENKEKAPLPAPGQSAGSNLPTGEQALPAPFSLRYRPELILCPERSREIDTLECHVCPGHDSCPAYA